MSRHARWWALVALVAAALLLYLLRAEPAAAPAEETTHAARAERGSAAARAGAIDRAARRYPVRFGPVARPRVWLSEAEPSSTPGRVGPIEGMVISRRDGRPLAGASLVFEGADPVSVETGPDGRFRFQPPAAGVYALALATAPGHLPFAPAMGQSPVRFRAREGRGLRNARIYLTGAAAYRIAVRDDAGAPIEGADVEVLGARAPGSPLIPAEGPQRTDARGEASVIAPDDAIVEARHPERGRGRARVDVAAQVSRRIEIVLRSDPPPPARVAGRVVRHDGEPVAGARVVAAFDPDNPALPGARLVPERSATTGADGTFSLEVDAGGPYAITASAPGLAPAVARGVRAPQDGLRLTLTRGASVVGRVIEAESGAPVASFVVIVTAARGAVEREVVAVEPTFDPAGEYRVGPLPEGTYFVRAAAQNYASAPEVRVELGGEDVEAVLALTEGGRITGRVLDAETGEPIPAARVSLEDEAAGESPALASVRTDDAGRFELRGVSGAAQSIFAVASGYHARVLGGLAPAEGQALDVTVALTPVEEGDAPSIELAGIGAVLSAQGDVVLVGEIVPEGGAAEAGLAPGDAILAVGGAGVEELGFAGTIRRIRGPEGSTVALRVRKAGGAAPVTIEVVRRRVRAR